MAKTITEIWIALTLSLGTGLMGATLSFDFPQLRMLTAKVRMAVDNWLN